MDDLLYIQETDTYAPTFNGLVRAVDGADQLARATADLAAATGGSSPDPVAPLLSAGQQIEAGPGCTLRDAAQMLGIGRVVEATERRGIFP